MCESNMHSLSRNLAIQQSLRGFQVRFIFTFFSRIKRTQEMIQFLCYNGRPEHLKCIQQVNIDNSSLIQNRVFFCLFFLTFPQVIKLLHTDSNKMTTGGLSF